jgi:DNA modification methylase
VSASWEIRQGHVLDRLREMDDASVHCCITSPPYYRLRDYGTGEWEGGSSSCDHIGPSAGGTGASTLGNYNNGLTQEPIEAKVAQRQQQYRSECRRCGGRRVDQQIGLEETPDEYVAKLVEVFAEVKRVLRDDGTLWLNLGDSYASHGGERGSTKGPRLGGTPQALRGTPRGHRTVGGVAKAKDLIGIPWMVAFALRADGWYLRRDIIWSKPNPMPESVTDRPTTAHEYVFLLSKSPRYFYDFEAIKEPAVAANEHDYTGTARRGIPGQTDHSGNRREKRNLREGVDTKGGNQANGVIPWSESGRNKRSVWTILPQRYPEAHFATFPPKLIEPMVLAGSAPEVCVQCAAPWRRIVTVEYENPGNRSTNGPRSVERRYGEFGSAGFAQRLERRAATIGWEPTCDHADGGGRAVVLDPFAGSGTTLQVAVVRGRSAIGIELSPEYVEMVERRMSGVSSHPDAVELGVAIAADGDRARIAARGQLSIEEVP